MAVEDFSLVETLVKARVTFILLIFLFELLNTHETLVSKGGMTIFHTFVTFLLIDHFINISFYFSFVFLILSFKCE
ncbi:MAG: hypothetical protein JSV04_13155 [Candidatus Heimdallarchaeota archaeon]|nr:MAG: hypothetical protein JSV04_13155 [Candidatus Heimdallarchaeota archaeon]